MRNILLVLLFAVGCSIAKAKPENCLQGKTTWIPATCTECTSTTYAYGTGFCVKFITYSCAKEVCDNSK